VWKKIRLGLLMCVAVLVAGALYFFWPNAKAIQRARESVLKQDLYDLRSLIKEYSSDKQRRPASLQDLVASGYMDKVPADPMTRRSDTWVIEQSTDATTPGIVDIHSGSRTRSSEGNLYSDW